MEQYKENEGGIVTPEVSSAPEKSKFQEMKDSIKSKATKAMKWGAIAVACVGSIAAINQYGGNTVEANSYKPVYSETGKSSDYMKFETTVPEGKTVMKVKSNRTADSKEVVTNVTAGEKVMVDYYDNVTFE